MKIIYLILIIILLSTISNAETFEFSFELYSNKSDSVIARDATLYLSTGYFKTVGDVFIAHNSYYNSEIIGHQLLGQSGVSMRIGVVDIIKKENVSSFLQVGYFGQRGIITISHFYNHRNSRTVLNFGVISF